MADREDFLSFDNALRELQLNEDQLKRLVSEGEIRAIRGEHNTMRFRREEIERLKQDTGKTIQYTEESSETLTDDLLFDESDDLDVEDEGMATAQISSEDTFVGDDDAGMTTEPIAQSAPPPVTSAKPSAARGQTQSLRRTTGRSTRMRAATATQAVSGIGMGMMALLILTAIVSLYCVPFIADMADDSVSGPTRGFADLCGEKFGGLKGK